jgi:enamine deaminase RidA (YjgF/YER057c/UK114 family)
MNTIERWIPSLRLEELGLVLPPACKAAGNYRPAVIVGNRLIISGHTQDDAVSPEETVFGKVGGSVNTEQAYQAARDIGLAVLASAKAALGGKLSRIICLVKATGVVNAVETFTDHPKVINGFSDLMREVFGPENGVGARNATGVASLPGGVAVEITECEFLIEADNLSEL